jgi:hypothetical protein
VPGTAHPSRGGNAVRLSGGDDFGFAADDGARGGS